MTQGEVFMNRLKLGPALGRSLYVILWIVVFALNVTAQERQNEKITIAVVGGTSLERGGPFAEGIAANEGQFTVDTAAGPSPTIYKRRYKGVPFYYVRFHGYSEKETSDRLTGENFVRTWAALYKLGVTHVFGGATTGGIQDAYQNGDLVIADDLINFNYWRPSSVMVAAKIDRPRIRSRFNPPFCPDMRKILYELASKMYQGRVHNRGVVVQTQPNRYETPAEIRMFRTMGGDMATHNVGTEAIYARQLGIHYAVVNSISNPAEGVRPFTIQEELAAGLDITKGAVPIVLEAIVAMSKKSPDCGIICTGEKY